MREQPLGREEDGAKQLDRELALERKGAQVGEPLLEQRHVRAKLQPDARDAAGTQLEAQPRALAFAIRAIGEKGVERDADARALRGGQAHRTQASDRVKRAAAGSADEEQPPYSQGGRTFAEALEACE